MAPPRRAELRITRTIRLPDPLRVELYGRAPELGPKILFFSGGTALRETSRSLVHLTHNSIHLISPFDAGGSSAVLREAFRMLAVGDLRNRLLALADRSVQGHPEVFELFAFRFPKDASAERLSGWLEQMVDGVDPLVTAVPDPMRKLIRNHLRYFLEAMPVGFDLRGANIGNLILVGGYLNNSRHIDPVIFLFSKLVNVRGLVRPTTNRDFHLAAELESGEVLVGQHLLTGKEVAPIDSSIRRLWLARSLDDPEPVRAELRGKVRQLIVEADVICYPMGSFYSSLIANLLVSGVGDAIAESEVPKVYVPNTTADPEMLGVGLSRSVALLLEYLQRSCDRDVEPTQLLQYVLIDRSAARLSDVEAHEIEGLGVQVVDVSLITDKSQPYIDSEKLARCLVSLA